MILLRVFEDNYS